MSNELYKQKLQALITSNNSKARELGINTAVLKDTVQQSFKSYKEAYEFFAVLKKGITSAKTDTALVRKSASKNLATQATTYGVESVSFSVFCSNSCGVQATFGVGSVAAEWTVSGSLGYYWIKNSPTSPKQYQSVSPSASCSTPIYSYSGVGAMQPSTGGGWNGASASYSCEKNVQIVYTVSGTAMSYYVKTYITASLAWTPTPQEVYVNHSMTAQAY